jgi:hypothetical protein
MPDDKRRSETIVSGELDVGAVGEAFKKLSDLGEYLVLDDINDLGKIDHLHHYMVGLMLLFLGIGGEMAMKGFKLVQDLMNNEETPPVPQAPELDKVDALEEPTIPPNELFTIF